MTQEATFPLVWDELAGSPAEAGSDGGTALLTRSDCSGSSGLLPLGVSASFRAWGRADTPFDQRGVAAGCTGQEAVDGQAGEVLLYDADTTTGDLGLRTQVLAPTGRSDLFGASLANVDARVCIPGSPEEACGDELLVGAPEDGDGNVYWFQNEWAGGFSYQLGGTLPRPAAATTLGSSFGSAIAVHPQAEWLAVADAGSRAVFVYRFDPTSGSATPFSLETTSLDATSLGTGGAVDFGSSIQIGDFNGDGDLDLAVGSVRDFAGTNGRVDIFAGNGAASGFPLSTTPDATLTRASYGYGTAGADEFGFALGAGRTVAAAAGDALLVGAPGDAQPGLSDTGAVCQAGFNNAWALVVDGTRCQRGLPSPASGDRLGESIAVANLVHADSLGHQDGTFASHPEIAVGAPGRGASGSVFVYLSGETGLATTRDSSALELTSTGTGFGSTLVAGSVQSTEWDDLLIGEPGRPGISLTRGTGYEDCDEVYGTWQVADNTGALKTVRIWRNEDTPPRTIITFAEDFEFDIHENGDPSDPACSFTDSGVTHTGPYSFPAGTPLVLNGRWSCGGPVTQTFINTSADPVFQAIVRATGGSTYRAGEVLDVALVWNSTGGCGSASDHVEPPAAASGVT